MDTLYQILEKKISGYHYTVCKISKSFTFYFISFILILIAHSYKASFIIPFFTLFYQTKKVLFKKWNGPYKI